MSSTTRNLALRIAAVATFAVIAMMSSCGESSIEPVPTLTPEELAVRRELQFDELPDYDKLRISDDIGVHYLHCDPAPTYDPISYVLLVHFPSGSWVSPLPARSGVPRSEYKTPESRVALSAVVDDDELMEQVLERSPEPVRCPAELATQLPEVMSFWNEYDYMDVTEDIRARFDTCYSDEERADVITIYHMPSWSSVSIGGEYSDGVNELRFVVAPSSRERLQEVLEDDALMERVRAASDKAFRCPESPTPHKEPAAGA